MAEEWYLLKPPYSQTSGFENDALDFSKDAFLETLDTEIAVDIEYCSPDLSECTPMRAVVMNRVQDTKLNAFKRHLYLPIGSCKAGYLVKYKNRYWLIEGLVDDNGMYEKAVLVLCNWLMTWLNDKGEVVQRWSNIQSASQYNNGQRENRYYTLRTDQLLVCLPYDKECIMLDESVRFIIDKRIEYYEQEIPEGTEVDTSFSLITYECTRNDSVLYNYIDSGHYDMLVTQSEQHNGDGYYKIGDKGYWLCSHEIADTDTEQDDEQDTPTGVVTAKIIADSDKLYIGLGATEFTAVFTQDGQVIDIEPEWIIDCDFVDKLQVDNINNTICISVDNYDLLNKSFELFLRGYEDDKVKVTIIGLV